MKKSFLASEPLFFKCIYIIAFAGVLYVIYENIFLAKEKHFGIDMYLLALFGFLQLRKYNASRKMRKSDHSQETTNK
jgi:hypothetical protein